MHEIEPFYNWRDKYTAEDDDKSPFFKRIYDEFKFSNKVYNYFIHPQWDSIGSETLYVKLLFAEYNEGYAIIELIGEWNDAIDSDIATFKRDFIDELRQEGLSKFILVGEQILNFHGDGTDYYEEWQEDVDEDGGWIVGLNYKDHVIQEMEEYGIQKYIKINSPFNQVKWRSYKPEEVYELIDGFIFNWLEDGLKKLATK